MGVYPGRGELIMRRDEGEKGINEQYVLARTHTHLEP